MAKKKHHKKHKERNWGAILFVLACICGICFGLWYIIFVMRRESIQEIRVSYLRPRGELTRNEYVYDEDAAFGYVTFSDGKMSIPHGADTEPWLASPIYAAVDDSGDLLRFYDNGNLRSIRSTDKRLKTLEGPQTLKTMEENAVLYKLQIQMYSKEEMEQLKQEYPDEAEFTQHAYARRWFAYMGTKDVKRAYIFSMDADKYGKQEFLMFMKSVKIDR